MCFLLYEGGDYVIMIMFFVIIVMLMFVGVKGGVSNGKKKEVVMWEKWILFNFLKMRNFLWVVVL